ncbi:MAG: hypothetical protein HC933_05030 [Pleurocapsa sp. SU_196_0]|nr:hypothetical protein [Pleurocapsa sp. SU_196_0]
MVEFDIAGRMYKVHKPTLGVQMMVLSKYKEESDQFRLMKTLHASIKVETAAGSGVFRLMTSQEFDALDDDTFQPFRRAFRDLRGKANARLVLLEDFLELFPDAPLELQVWAQNIREQVESEDPFA